jgi:GMP synthase-like glutamine amidotransferase
VITDNVCKIGVMPICLTSIGTSFFESYLPSDTQYRIHEFHELEVKTPGKGFFALAENNQCLVNATNTILTFQGHPEMSASLSALLLSQTPKYMGIDAAEKQALDVKIKSEHDGLAIWKRIIQWAKET